MTGSDICNVLASAPHPRVSVPMLASFLGVQTRTVLDLLDPAAVITSKLGARQDLHAKLRAPFR